MKKLILAAFAATFISLGAQANGTHDKVQLWAGGQSKVYRSDDVGGVTNAVAPMVTRKSSAVKVEMTVDAPADAPAQFFKVKFSE